MWRAPELGAEEIWEQLDHFASSDANQTLRDIFDRSAYTTSDIEFPANTFIFSQCGDVAVGRNQRSSTT